MLSILSGDSDPAAIERARSGDCRAFSPLVEAYQAPIFNLCYRILGNPHDAEGVSYTHLTLPTSDLV